MITTGKQLAKTDKLIYKVEEAAKKSMTIEEYIRKTVTLDNWKEYLYDSWMHHLQDDLGLNGEHPCLSFDIVATYIIEALLIRQAEAIRKKILELKTYKKDHRLYYDSDEVHKLLNSLL